MGGDVGKAIQDGIDASRFKKKPGPPKPQTLEVSDEGIGAEEEQLQTKGKRRSVISTIRAGALQGKRNSLG